MYKERVHILDDSVIVEEIGAPELVPLIEAGITSGKEIDAYLREYLGKFSPDIEALVLGCTHYPLISGRIKAIWEDLIQFKSEQSRYSTFSFIDPGIEAAKKFSLWLERHA